LVRRFSERVGHSVVRADFYSPLVDTRSLPPSTWSRAAPVHGLDLDLDVQLQMIEDLSPFVAEFRPAVRRSDDPLEFYLENDMYGPMDAHILYGMLRRAPPQRVLELGSGYSSLVIQEALKGNRADGVDGAHEVVDPHPSSLLAATPRAHVRRESGARVAEEVFATLGAGDVLFVDTSHTVRPGGEVVRLVLEVLPVLAPGVVVHFHDIYRPFEYPRVFYDLFNVHWQEQYLLQAFLSYNANYAVLCANHALWRLRRPQVMPLFEGLLPGREPSGFWFERVEASPR
jgi:predicted O-methyltransferase YrrM